MSDLEGLTRNLIRKGFTKDEIIARLVSEYMDFKDIEKQSAIKFAEALYIECIRSDLNNISDPFMRDLLEFNRANVTIGKQGVGCRGAGDFFVHKLITELSETDYKAFLSPSSLDDAGAVRISDIKGFRDHPYGLEDLITLSKMEGIHSGLSDFPFICGFQKLNLKKLIIKVK